MSPCSESLSGKLVNANQESATNAPCNLLNLNKIPVEHEEEEEEEDVDFNPLWNDSSSAEASSSLSSEVEGMDVDVIDSVCDEIQAIAPNCTSERQSDGLLISSSREEITEQTEVSSQEHGDIRLENLNALDPEKTKSDLAPQSENDTIIKKNTATRGAHVSNDFLEEEINMASSRMLCNPLDDDDDDDAICKRTRARYSLASFTLDELEAFLQETDDDDDLPDVDDEEEYRKFLAAVFNDGNEDGDVATPDHGNDEDEENDADFELELEEALECDIFDCVDLNQKGSESPAARRPETRRKKHQLSSIIVKEKVPKSTRKPLRPLVPVFSGAAVAPPSGYNGQHALLQTTQNLPSWSNQHSVNVFTPDQMGQLYCLIHEHVQLLVQVYSLSALEPSRKNIASQVQDLLSEMLRKREEALSVRKFPHSTSCFRSPHIYPSVLDENPRHWRQLEENDTEPSQIHDSQSSADPQGCASRHDQPSKGSTIQDLQGSSWFPYLDGPIFSILDVAPLKLVRKYIEGVTIAVQEQMRRYVEVTDEPAPEKQPLFPLLYRPSQVVSNAKITKGTAGRERGGVSLSLSLSNHGPPKKTLAATIVESTKKQSVALVHQKIAELAMQFYPLLNPALFPHKPPPLSVANRILFTDSEDELLAMGLMEYNTDWTAIQRRFLPCKSVHQIFVRQKNRCSSKAPDNCIKAVRRFKMSPLSMEEIACISEGIKMFRHDWTSIWKFFVPYRDPSNLPRQWRVALGTQKSYKMDPSKREKRRLYERKRRKSKPIESEDSCVEKDNEVYAHELFLSDSGSVPTVPSTLNANSGQLRGDSNMDEPESHDRGYSKHGSLAQGREVSRSWVTGQASRMEENLPFTKPASRSFRYEPIRRPYRSRRPKRSHMVRLAPDLPPLNLPPSVRVISEAAYRNPQYKPPSGTENIVSPCRLGNTSNSARDMDQRKELSRNHGNNTSGSDIVMHPSVSQAPGNRHVPGHQLTIEDIGPSSLSLRPASLGQKNLPSDSSSFRKVPVGADCCEPSGNAVACNGAVELNLGRNTLLVSTEKDSTTDGREGDPSLLDIVMEQEELSDSEEEMEQVEFECEEMADSDCEDVESNSGHIVNTLDKEPLDTTDNCAHYLDQLDESNSRPLHFPGSRETGEAGSSESCLNCDDGATNRIATGSDVGKVMGSGENMVRASIMIELFGNDHDNVNDVSTQNKPDVPLVATSSSSRVRRKRMVTRQFL